MISVLMVLALTWVVIPNLTRVFAAWLTSDRGPFQAGLESRR